MQRIERGRHGGIVRPLAAGHECIETRIQQDSFGQIGQIFIHQQRAIILPEKLLDREQQARTGAAQDVARLVPEARFVAVGQGGRGAGGVEELGLLDDPALGRVLDGARVLMAPNLYGESFGIVLIEGLAHGAAVVASDLAAFRDVVDDPAVATFFPAGDAMAAAETLRARLSAPHDRGKARQVAERYSWGIVGPQVLEAYRRAG